MYINTFFLCVIESPAQSVPSGVRAPSPTPSAVSLGSEKNSNVSQDRKVPVPIGTERSARIRQTGTSTPSVIGSNLATPVGHSGIWSFEGIGGNQGMMFYPTDIFTHVIHCNHFAFINNCFETESLHKLALLC